MSLTERRAEFVYNAARLAAIAAQAPIIPVPWYAREIPFRTQFLDVIERQCGPDYSNSPEELHDSWISQLERDKDAVFILLCQIAREYIY